MSTSRLLRLPPCRVIDVSVLAGLLWTLILSGVVAGGPSVAQAAVVNVLSDAPKAQLATPGGPGVTPRMGTSLAADGSCVATTDGWTPGTYGAAEVAAHQACLDTLLPKRPVPVLQTPGSFFVGYAWGGNSKQWVYGPQVGVGGAVLIPWRRPSLKLKATSASGGGDVPAGTTFTFTLPSDMSFAAALAISFNANLAAFTFPNAAASTTAQGTTQQGFNAGVYAAPQVGWMWWDGGNAKSVMFSLGIMAGYIKTDATGSAFAIGLQPGLVAQF